jgi:tripartite-type tricarboxylate transporter receptor subunit TctC
MAAAFAFTTAAQAQDYPNKPIKAIVPFGAGGGTDTQTRMWAEAIAPLIGQRVLVENMGGGGGVMGTKAGIAAEPDGYTLLMGVGSTIAINPQTVPEADYSPLEDLQPVAVIGYTPWCMIISSKLPMKTLQEIIAYDKEHPGELTMARWSNTGEIGRKGLELRSGLELLPVPYQGMTPAMTDIIAGRTSIAMLDLASALPFIKSGDVRPVVLTGTVPVEVLPDLPTMDQAGIENYDVNSWVTLWAPKGTPMDIVEFLNAKTREALQTDAIQDRYAELAIEYLDYDVAQTRKFVEGQINGWKEMIAETGSAKP